MDGSGSDTLIAYCESSKVAEGPLRSTYQKFLSDIPGLGRSPAQSPGIEAYERENVQKWAEHEVKERHKQNRSVNEIHLQDVLMRDEKREVHHGKKREHNLFGQREVEQI